MLNYNMYNVIVQYMLYTQLLIIVVYTTINNEYDESATDI